MWGQANRARGQHVQESGEVKEGANPRGKARMGPECWVQGTSSGSMEEEPGLTFCLGRGAQLERQVERDLRYLRGEALGSSLGVTAPRREGSKDAVYPPEQDAAAQLCLTVARRRAWLRPRGGAPPGAGLLGAGLPASAAVPGPGAQTRSGKKVYPNSETSCLVSFTHSFIQSLRIFLL